MPVPPSFPTATPIPRSALLRTLRSPSIDTIPLLPAVRKRLFERLARLPVQPQRRLVRILPIDRRQSHSRPHGILLRLPHLPQLLSPGLLLLPFPLLRRQLGIVGFGVPAQIFVLLPTPDRSHERVAQVVFAVGGGFDFVPAEVHAAAGAGLADGLEEVHGCCAGEEKFGWGCRAGKLYGGCTDTRVLDVRVGDGGGPAVASSAGTDVAETKLCTLSFKVASRVSSPPSLDHPSYLLYPA